MKFLFIGDLINLYIIHCDWFNNVSLDWMGKDRTCHIGRRCIHMSYGLLADGFGDVVSG